MNAGFLDIQFAQWFVSVDWAALELQEVPMPPVPVVASRHASESEEPEPEPLDPLSAALLKFAKARTESVEAAPAPVSTSLLRSTNSSAESLVPESS
eukprot:4419322-Pleurochrysis_carterae.AAC.1